MIESVKRRGYRHTAVADVIALAGVSRRAFYEHFRDKDHCLLATHNAIVAHGRQLSFAAWSTESGWSNRLYSACQSLFAAMGTLRDQAHFVLVDSLGTMPGARERALISNLAFERPLHEALRHGSPAHPLPFISATAVIGGIRHVMMREIQDGDLVAPRLSEEVLDWIECYRASSASTLLARPKYDCPVYRVRPLIGSGPHALASRALLDLTLERGYARVSDSDVARHTGISTNAFHKLFQSKESCLLANRRALIEASFAAARSEMEHADSWAEGVHRGIEALTGVLSAYGPITRVALIDFLDIGPGAIAEYSRPMDELALLLTAEAPRLRALPKLAPCLVSGAIWAVICAHATGDMLPRLPQTADRLTYTVLAPYLGATRALEEMSSIARGAS